MLYLEKMTTKERLRKGAQDLIMVRRLSSANLATMVPQVEQTRILDYHKESSWVSDQASH